MGMSGGEWGLGGWSWGEEDEVGAWEGAVAKVVGTVGARVAEWKGAEDGV